MKAVDAKNRKPGTKSAAPDANGQAPRSSSNMTGFGRL